MAKPFTFKALALSVLILSGCASPVGPGLQTLEGKNIRTAINYLGYPDREQQVLGDTIYIWRTGGTYTDIYPITDVDRGEFEVNGRRGRYDHETTSYVSEVYTYSCTLKMAVNENDIIKHTQAISTGGGCSRYNSAFNQLLEDYNISAEEAAETLEKPQNQL